MEEGIALEYSTYGVNDGRARNSKGEIRGFDNLNEVLTATIMSC